MGPTRIFTWLYVLIPVIEAQTSNLQPSCAANAVAWSGPRVLMQRASHGQMDLAETTAHSDSHSAAFTQVSIQEEAWHPMPTSLLGCEVNPSGEETPLNQAGYFAVKTRCCLYEMMTFVRRVVDDLDMEVCSEGGVIGLAPYHTCGTDREYADLVNDIERDAESRCTWVAPKGSCRERPADCENFAGLAPPPDCGCSRAQHVPLNFRGASMGWNNLAGTDWGPQIMRIENIGVADGGQFDLVISPLNTYQPGGRNQITGDFAQIGLKGGTSVDLRFTFMKTGTMTPVKLAQVLISFFDLDGVVGKEQLYVSGYSGYVTDVTTMLSVDRATDGRTRFVQNEENVPNPSDVEKLTPMQRRTSVMFFFKEKSSFDVTFRIVSDLFDRHLFFSGASELIDRCGP